MDDLITGIMGSIKAEYFFGPMLLNMLQGFGLTAALFFLTIVFSIPLGMLVSMGRMSKYKIISLPIQFYISVMRGTPLMLQIMVVFYAPAYIFHLNFPRLIAGVIAFSLNYSAYFAEIFRGGIQSISVSQYEASSALGLSRKQTFFHVILPQVIKRVTPASCNEIVTLVKDTSLAYVIAVGELFYVSKGIMSSKSGAVIALVVAGVFYYLFNLLVSFVLSRVEKKLNYYQG